VGLAEFSNEIVQPVQADVCSQITGSSFTIKSISFSLELIYQLTPFSTRKIFDFPENPLQAKGAQSLLKGLCPFKLPLINTPFPVKSL